MSTAREDVSAQAGMGPLRALMLYGAAPVLVMAALFGLISTHSAWHEERASSALPMEVGPLWVHGPLEVRGSVLIDGDLKVHGPLDADRISRKRDAATNPQSKFPATQPEALDLKVINGPFDVRKSLHIGGNLEVDGPMRVRGPLMAGGSIRADGPVRDRSR